MMHERLTGSSFSNKIVFELKFVPLEVSTIVCRICGLNRGIKKGQRNKHSQYASTLIKNH